MVKRRAQAPPKFDLMEAAEWISDRTEVDIEIAMEILEAEYQFLKGSGVAGGGGEIHRVIASREQVEAVAQKVAVDHDTIKSVLDSFMAFLQTKGYVHEVLALPPGPS